MTAALSQRPVESITPSAAAAADSAKGGGNGGGDATPLTLSKPSRLRSLDAFRGLTMGGMVLANNPAGPSYAALEHAEWHGWTMTDLVFPFFLFIVGVAIPFAFGARQARGASRGELAVGVVTRGVSLIFLSLLVGTVPPGKLLAELPAGFAWVRALQIGVIAFAPIGMILLLWPWKTVRTAAWVTGGVVAAWFVVYFVMSYVVNSATGELAKYDFGSALLNPSDFRDPKHLHGMRFPGILQRIGACYIVVGLLALVRVRALALLAAVGACSAYLWLMYTFAFNGSEAGSFEAKTNLARAVDLYVFGPHVYGAYPDPEGLLSTLPAIATTLIGLMAGRWLVRADKPMMDRAAGMMAGGLGVAMLGVVLSWWVPVNKSLWTPAFAVLTAGLGCLTLGAMFLVIDVKGRKAWSLPLAALGSNAILVFLLSSVFARTMGLIKVPVQWYPPEIVSRTAKAAVKSGGDVGIRSVWVEWTTFLQQHATPVYWHSPEAASLAYSVSFLLVMVVITLVLYRFRWFVKV